LGGGLIMMYELVYRKISSYDDDTIDVFMRAETKDEINKVVEQYKIPVRTDWDKMSCGFYIREIATLALQEYELKWQLNKYREEKERLEKQKAEGPIFDFSGLENLFK
jgi:hypothetical protein